MSEQPRDHIPPEPGESSDTDSDTGPKVEENIKQRSTWIRLLFIIVFGFIYALSRIVVFAIVVLQFFWLLFTGETNPRLTATGQSFATYTYQLVRYLTFNTEERPFPFDDWPSAKPL